MTAYYVLVERDDGKVSTFRQEAGSLKEAVEMSEAEHLALFKMQGRATLAGRHDR